MKDWKETILVNWGELNKKVQSCTEEECKTLLDYERKTKKRLTLMLRIYGRMNKLRCTRERLDIYRASEQ